jgi:hypothetical protein
MALDLLIIAAPPELLQQACLRGWWGPADGFGRCRQRFDGCRLRHGVGAAGHDGLRERNGRFSRGGVGFAERRSLRRGVVVALAGNQLEDGRRLGGPPGGKHEGERGKRHHQRVKANGREISAGRLSGHRPGAPPA